MAVTRIRKLSSWTMLIVSLISIVVMVLFYAGGVVDPNAEVSNPVNTGLLINWTIILFVVTIVAMIVLALWHLFGQMRVNAKGGLRSLLVVVAFVAIFIITYAIGSATPIPGLNADSQEFNTPFWLKLTDMWIYTSVVLIVLIVIALVAGVVKRSLKK